VNVFVDYFMVSFCRTIQLQKPNLATIDYDNRSFTGNWTRMDVEGAEIFVDGLHYRFIFRKCGIILYQVLIGITQRMEIAQ
jgi:hypothetical protein